MPRRILEGTVVSAHGNKTLVVKVERTTKHPIYGKTLRTSKKFHAHDEANVGKMGDFVAIIESPPRSKLKHFDLHSVVIAAGDQVTDSASDVQA